jgi:hypothetical protein
MSTQEPHHPLKIATRHPDANVEEEKEEVGRFKQDPQSANKAYSQDPHKFECLFPTFHLEQLENDVRVSSQFNCRGEGGGDEGGVGGGGEP